MKNVRDSSYLECTVAPQAAVPNACLNKREVGSAEHSLGGLQRLHFACTSLLAHCVILQKPVAFCMQGLNVLKSGHMSSLCCSLLLCVCLKLGLQFCLFLLLGSQCLRICRSFLSCIFHSLLIIFLSILLLSLGLSHLLCKV